MEEWKDIIFIDNNILYDYSGLYKISNYGRIMSVKRSKIMKYAIKKNGYCQICLRKNRNKKNFLVHRLVALVFLENTNNLSQVNHKDENKENNRVDNLEWCSPKYNSNYGTRNDRVSNSQKEGNNSIARKVVCKNTKEVFNSLKEAKDWCNGDVTGICLCCQGKQGWSGKHPITNKKLYWEYFELN